MHKHKNQIIPTTFYYTSVIRVCLTDCKIGHT